jgi:hypothetical protein
VAPSVEQLAEHEADQSGIEADAAEGAGDVRERDQGMQAFARLDVSADECRTACAMARSAGVAGLTVMTIPIFRGSSAAIAARPD